MWKYNNDGSVQTNTVTTRDTVIQGKTFQRILQGYAGTVTNSFFREEAGNTYAFADLYMMTKWYKQPMHGFQNVWDLLKQKPRFCLEVQAQLLLKK